MNEIVAAISAVPSVGSSVGVNATGPLAASPAPAAPQERDVVNFRSMVEGAHGGTPPAQLGSQIFEAGVNLSNKYLDRIGTAREFTSFSAEELGVDERDYLRASLTVQIALNEVAVELQSTAQIANSVKDSFNTLYRMQG